MSKIVSSNHQEIFNQFASKNFSLDQRVQFLELAIECRVKALLKLIDPKHVVSATVVNKRLNSPLACRHDLEQLKSTQTLSHDALDHIQQQLFGQL